VTERRVGLGRLQSIKVYPEVAERSTRDFVEAEVAKHIGQESTDEKFE
jgi:hypothetical protein